TTKHQKLTTESPHKEGLDIPEVYLAARSSKNQPEQMEARRIHDRTMDLDMVLGSSLGLVVTSAPGGGEGHPDQHCPSGSIAPGPKHGPKRQPRPLESAWSSMAIEVMDINTDPGY
ncbi:hypothetical protein STEG23_015242, partial [Scotinomys teguina]